MSLVNSPGTIDSGYRGEIKVIVINHDPVHDLELQRGDRIAQLVFQRVEQARFVEVDELPDSDRGCRRSRVHRRLERTRAGQVT